MEDGWIEWSGGECPVPYGLLVDVKHADGEVYLGHRAMVQNYKSYAAHDWSHTNDETDILAYKIISTKD